MARISIPNTLSKLQTLVATIAGKNTLLGTASPIKNLLAQHGIVLTTDLSALAAAIVLDNDRDTLTMQAENLNGMRDNAAEVPMTRAASFGQILKRYYAPVFTELGLWDFDIMLSGKITYTADAAKRVDLMKKIKQKHEAFPAGESPLAAYIAKEEIDLAALVALLENAAGFEADSRKATAQAENKTEQRNLLVKPVLKNVRTIVGFLMVFHADNPKELGDWGIGVIDQKKKPREQKTKIKLLDKKTITGILIGSNLSNLGAAAINVFKGKKITGTPVTVLPGKDFAITKGHSKLTVVNLSAETTAIVKVQVHK